MEEDNSWIFDSLVCFLNGPIWNAPLQSFIEEKSLIFEPNVTDNIEYENIFDEFKNLVDFMLGSFMEDIGITPEQFENACERGHNHSFHFDYNLFEQIWAANDYEMFKRMMTQRNVELQLQALELIEQKYGITPQSFIPHKRGEKDSQDSSTNIQQTVQIEKEIMDEIVKGIPKEEASTSKEEVKYILKEKEQLERTLKETKEKANTQIVKPLDVVEISKEKRKEIDKIDKPTVEEIKFDKNPTKAEIDSIELKKRQEYLRAQRDKLVALKKEVRKKHLDAENNSGNNKSKVRPKSAKAAQAVLAGDKAAIEPQQLQIRRALVERLKPEVVTDTKQ